MRYFLFFILNLQTPQSFIRTAYHTKLSVDKVKCNFTKISVVFTARSKELFLPKVKVWSFSLACGR